MPTLFYQKYWEIVADSVSTTCLHILNDGGSIAEWNRMIVTLISKVKEPVRITQFRLISLGNVVSKLVTKTIATRLICILDSIISPY